MAMIILDIVHVVRHFSYANLLQRSLVGPAINIIWSDGLRMILFINCNSNHECHCIYMYTFHIYVRK